MLFLQAARKLLTDDDVREFMRPRPLKWNKPLSIQLDPKLGPLSPESMAKLEEALTEASYVTDNKFSDADVLLYQHVTKNDQTSANVGRWKEHVTDLLKNDSVVPQKLPKDAIKSIKSTFQLK